MPSAPSRHGLWCKALSAPDRVSVDSLVIGDDEGHHHSHSDLLLPGFLRCPLSMLLVLSRNASFILSVDVTFTSTTFLQISSESRRSHTMSGLSLAPATRPFHFHSSDSRCSFLTVISPRAVLTVFRYSHFCSWEISPL